jgi:hypothetical protein
MPEVRFKYMEAATGHNARTIKQIQYMTRTQYYNTIAIQPQSNHYTDTKP